MTKKEKNDHLDIYKKMQFCFNPEQKGRVLLFTIFNGRQVCHSRGIVLILNCIMNCSTTIICPKKRLLRIRVTISFFRTPCTCSLKIIPAIYYCDSCLSWHIESSTGSLRRTKRTRSLLTLSKIENEDLDWISQIFRKFDSSWKRL